jgi:NDP-sugar pyrophosphorylase family protein
MNLEDFGSGTRFISPVIIDPGVSIGSNCLIGPNVYIETGAIIEDNVRLENCVVLREGKVSAGTRASDKVIW